MSGHGGRRSNAGRKPAESDLYTCIMIGSRCEELKSESQQEKMIEFIDKRIPKKTRYLREKIRSEIRSRAYIIKTYKMTGVKGGTLSDQMEQFKKVDDAAIKRVLDEVKPVIDKKGGFFEFGRTRHARPMSREDIMRKVSKECRDAGRQAITPRRVKEYWIQYNNFVRACRAEQT